jgi:hypothetical protein
LPNLNSEDKPVTQTINNSSSNANPSGAATTPDITPPVIEEVINGTKRSNGWYTGDVRVSWNVYDEESEVTPDNTVVL